MDDSSAVSNYTTVSTTEYFLEALKYVKLGQIFRANIFNSFWAYIFFQTNSSMLYTKKTKIKLFE